MQIEEPDYVVGGDTRDFFRAGNGDDFLVGGEEADTLFGGAGDDTIVGDSYVSGQHYSFDTVQLQPGEDDFINSAELLVGGAGDDLIIGGGWDDSITDDARFTPDEITNPDLIIEIFPSVIRNKIWGGEGDDSLYAAAGGDTLGGGAGADFIQGGYDNDVIFGGSGADTIVGGAGNDQIWSGSNDDTIWSGVGEDVFYFAEGHGHDRIEDFDPEFDSLVLKNTEYNKLNSGDGGQGPSLYVEQVVIDGVSGLMLSTGENDSIFLVGLTEGDFSSLLIIA